jgi:hypothetical protein
MCTRSGGSGSGVSMALANGCTSSGQRGSHTHSALPQCEQKRRSPGLGSPSITAWKTVIASSPSTRRLSIRPPRLIAKPPPPADLRQIEQ